MSAVRTARVDAAMSDDSDCPRLLYEDPGTWSREEVDKAIREDNRETLRIAVLGVCMYGDSGEYAQALCLKLSWHSDPSVRGNAVLGFGHIARVHRRLDREVVEPILHVALQDSDPYVRGHAASAIDDVRHFLGW